MNGSFMFAAELMYAIDEDFEVAFARYSSYLGTQKYIRAERNHACRLRFNWAYSRNRRRFD